MTEKVIYCDFTTKTVQPSGAHTSAETASVVAQGASNRVNDLVVGDALNTASKPPKLVCHELNEEDLDDWYPENTPACVCDNEWNILEFHRCFIQLPSGYPVSSILADFTDPKSVTLLEMLCLFREKIIFFMGSTEDTNGLFFDVIEHKDGYEYISSITYTLLDSWLKESILRANLVYKNCSLTHPARKYFEQVVLPKLSDEVFDCE